MKKTCFFLSSILLLTSCLKEEDLKRPFRSFVPRQINDGWELSSPSAEGIDSSELAKIYKDFHADDNIWQARSLLVFRNGKLVAESYTKDENDIDTPRAIWSVTKQVLGLLTGIAIDRHLINSVNDPVSDYLTETEIFQDKRDIKIEQLLTMRSGIEYSNDGLKGQSDDILRQLPEKITEFILGLPLAYKPGEKSKYKDCDPQLVSAIIQSGCGMSTASWASEVLFDKLEIKNLYWHNYKDGITLGGFGILTTPREMAKFGKLVLDSGQWKGTTIVGKEWIQQMTTIRIKDMYGYQFGYLWWMDVNRNMTFMWGHGGQYVCILPSKNLMVVMTSEVNTQGEFQFGEEAFGWVDKIEKITFRNNNFCATYLN